MKLKSRVVIPLAIYLAVLGIVLQYNLLHPPVNDGVWEYLAYKLNLANGWQNRAFVVNYCLIPTLLPAHISQITHLDPYIVFRIWPALFYPLMPMFTYLIARRFMNTVWSIVCALLIIANSYIFYFPDDGRVGIALGFFAGMMWALLGSRYKLLLLFTILTIFSHYGTATIALAIVVVYTIATRITERRWFKTCVSACLILVIAISIWYVYIPKTYGDSNLLRSVVYNEPGSFNDGTSPEVKGVIPKDPQEWVEIESRDTVVQSAFGANFFESSTPYKIELIINWVIVLLLTLGLFLVTRLKLFDARLRILMLTSYAMVTAVVAVPWLSVNYGVTRTLFTSSIVLAIGFTAGTRWVAKKIRIPELVLAAVVLVVYACSTSGFVYLPFGESKLFPVATVNPEVIKYIEAQE